LVEGERLISKEFERLPTSIENMDPSSGFTRTLAAVPIVPAVRAHSIVAINDDGPPEKGTVCVQIPERAY